MAWGKETSDILERGSAWLDGQRIRHLSRGVTYSRDESSVEAKQRPGRPIQSNTGVISGLANMTSGLLKINRSLHG